MAIDYDAFERSKESSPSIEKLHKLMRGSEGPALAPSILWSHYNVWRNGDYPSFEQCLIAMILQLSEALTAYEKAELQRVMNQTTNIK